MRVRTAAARAMSAVKAMQRWFAAKVLRDAMQEELV